MTFLTAALGVAAAGCGSAKKSDATTTTGSAGGGQAVSAFQTCLAAHGVKTTGGFGGAAPGAGGQGRPPTGGRPPQGNSKQQKAFAACRSKLPAGSGGGPPGAPAGGKSNPAFAKYTSCLKKHGVTLGGSNSTAAFRKASAACAQYAPAAAGQGASGG